jgi:hypothetical protein
VVFDLFKSLDRFLAHLPDPLVRAFGQFGVFFVLPASRSSTTMPSRALTSWMADKVISYRRDDSDWFGNAHLDVDAIF